MSRSGSLTLFPYFPHFFLPLSPDSLFVPLFRWDHSLVLTKILERAVTAALRTSDPAPLKPAVLNYFRVLEYEQGGTLAAHVDISKKSLRAGRGEPARSTHTLLLYVENVREEHGGRTVLLEKEKGGREDGENVICEVAIREGRLLIFKHDCPHRGNLCVEPGKVVVRGECYFY